MLTQLPVSIFAVDDDNEARVVPSVMGHAL
jgi:hypothetical protein